ncbi:MAG: RNA polymerase sigma factor [Flammeovirgaceae bacterium]
MKDYERLFEGFYQQYYPMVYMLCLGYMNGNEAKSEDLVQEVFLNIWNALPKFRKEASPKTWIYRITVNTCLLDIRKSKKEQIDAVAEVPTPIKQDETSGQFEELYFAISKLEQLDRMIILLVLDEVEYAEIAGIVGIKEATLRVRIHRIKQKLNKLLKSHGPS